MKQRFLRRLAFAVAVSATSAAVYVALGSAASQANPPNNNSIPTISGNAVVGATLTASPGSWTGTTPITYAYQWERCDSQGAGCNDLSAATAQTYVVRNGDASHALRVAVTATNSDGTAGPVLSDPTAVVTSVSAPQNASAPKLSGSAKQGSTLTIDHGTWTGTSPITYKYEWQRCNSSGNNCTRFAAGTDTTYTLVSGDVGNRIQVLVDATNSAGTASKLSNLTDVIVTNAVAPANTAAPQINGTTKEGSTLTVTTGTWSGSTPISFAYQWERCNQQGSNCGSISGATGTSYVLTSADVGNKLQVHVTASNAGGSAGKDSNQTGIIASSSNAVPASTISLPDQLVVSGLSYPTGGHSRSPFLARIHVSDTAGHSVSGALVYVVGLPYGWVRPAAEVATDATGWATVTLDPTVKMPRRTLLVMFVRARTPQGDLLVGPSTRRLVQVRVNP